MRRLLPLLLAPVLLALPSTAAAAPSCSKQPVRVTAITPPQVKADTLTDTRLTATATANADRKDCGFAVRLVALQNGVVAKASSWSGNYKASTNKIEAKLSGLQPGGVYVLRFEARPKSGKKTVVEGPVSGELRTYQEPTVQTPPTLTASGLHEGKAVNGAVLQPADPVIVGNPQPELFDARIEPSGSAGMVLTEPNKRYRYCVSYRNGYEQGKRTKRLCSDWLSTGERPGRARVSRIVIEGQALRVEAGASGTVASGEISWWRTDKRGRYEDTGVRGDTYTLTPQDLDRKIIARYAYTNPWGWAGEPDDSSSIRPGLVRTRSASVRLNRTGQGSVASVRYDAEQLWRADRDNPEPTMMALQWLRCTTSAVGSCAPVEGKTTADYGILTRDDVGKRLRVRYTYQNALGTSTFESRASRTIKADDAGGIVVRSAPRVRGTTKVGRTLRASAGRYRGASSTQIFWQRCRGGCVDIAEGASYTLVADDKGARMRVRVVVTSPIETIERTSKQTRPVK